MLDSGNDVEEFKLLAQLTKACAQNQEFNKAAHVGEKAMEMISVNEDKALALFHCLGISYMKTDESGKAIQNLELALNLCQKVPNHPLKPELFKLTADATVKTGDVSSALKTLLKGLEAIRKEKNLEAEGDILIQ